MVIALIIMLSISSICFSQNIEGKILCAQTGQPLELVNIEIIGSGIGTISDKNGEFRLRSDDQHNEGSIRFSKIGYRTKVLLAGNLKRLDQKIVFLKPEIYQIREIQIKNSRKKTQRFGESVTTNDHIAFAINELGTSVLNPNETGVIINVGRKAIIKSIHFNIHEFRFDEIHLNLNIYSIKDGNDTIPQSMLGKPISASAKKEDVLDDQIYIDISDYSIIAEGNVLVTIKLTDAKGKGMFSIRTHLFSGYYFIRRYPHQNFKQQIGKPGIYFYGNVIK